MYLPKDISVADLLDGRGKETKARQATIRSRLKTSQNICTSGDIKIIY